MKKVELITSLKSLVQDNREDLAKDAFDQCERYFNSVLTESVQYRSLMASSSNLIGVIKDKQWERLNSHLWSFENDLKQVKDLLAGSS